MTIVIYLFTIILNLYFQKFLTKKYEKIVFIISYFFNLLLMIGYRNYSGFSNDLFNNKMEYRKIITGKYSNYELGYVWLNKIGRYLTEDFYIFRILMISIFLGILYILIKKYNKYPYYVIVIFSSYLLILSAEQFRYFIAFVFFQAGLYLLIFSKKKKWYLFFVGVASSIHSSFLLYLVLIFLGKNIRLKKYKVLLLLMCLISFVIFCNNKEIPGLSSILSLDIMNYIDKDRVMIYFSQKTNYGFLYVYLLYFSQIFLFYYSRKILKLNDEKIDKKILDRIEAANIILSIFLPLCMIQIVFYRIFRTMLLINYCYYSYIIYNKNLKLKKNFYYYCLLNILLWITIDLILKTKPKALLIPFFFDNIIL